MSRAAAAVGLPPNARLGLEAAVGSRRPAGRPRCAPLWWGPCWPWCSSWPRSCSPRASTRWCRSRRCTDGTGTTRSLSGFSGAEDLPATATAALLGARPGRRAFRRRLLRDGHGGRAERVMLAMRPGAPVAAVAALGSGARVRRPDRRSARRRWRRCISTSARRSCCRPTPDARTGCASSARPRCRPSAARASPRMGMGTGAVVASSLFSASDLNQQGSPIPGPMAELISVRPGVRPAVASGVAQPDRAEAQCAQRRRRTGRRRGRRAPPRRDRRLRQRQVHPGAPGRRAGSGGDRRAWG